LKTIKIMNADKEFIERLTILGLSEKESKLYYYLLKYGPKTPMRAAKYLGTYREDVHRMLANLVDKGLVTVSVSRPTTYTAVALDKALESARLRRAYEQQRIQEVERELLALSHLRAHVPEDVENYKVLKNPLDIIAASRQAILRAQRDIFFIPPDKLGSEKRYGVIDAYKEVRQRGVNIRAVCDVTPDGLPVVRELAAHRISFRHYRDYGGVRFLVIDDQESLTSISLDKPRPFEEGVAALWCDSPVYAHYLKHIFEMVWELSTDAAERIAELSRTSR
jgi:sugar-specific transcriptional regulator TrmB